MNYRTVITIVSVLVLFSPVLAADLSGSTGAGTPAPRVVWIAPNGVDDTSALQGAIDRCSGKKGPCVIRLTRGVFHTMPLVATDFHGAIEGAGRHLTSIETRTDRVLHLTKASPFNTRDPSPAEPWPAIMTFVEGDIRLADLTLAAPLGTKTDGWYAVCVGENPLFVPTLTGAIMASGRRPMNVTVERLSFEGAADPGDPFVGYTLIQSEVFAGFLLPAGFADPCLDLIRLRGNFVDRGTHHSQMAYGPFLVLTDGASASFTDSEYDVLVDAVQLYDLNRSRVLVSGNTARTVLGSGIIALQNGTPAAFPSDHAELTLTNNRVSTQTANVAGIQYFDYATDTSPRLLNISSNRVEMAAGSAFGIGVSGARNGVLIAGNRIAGTPDAGIGIGVDRTRRCTILLNSFARLANGVPDIVLGPATSRCVVVTASGDTVIDQGVDNRVVYH